MMKIEDIQIGISPITNTIYAGTITKDSKEWKQKKDITGQFIAVMLAKFPEGEHTITKEGKPVFNLTVKKVKVGK
jgi:hypothetical protein